MPQGAAHYTMRAQPLYHVFDPATGRYHCQDATGAPVGLVLPAPGLHAAALRKPIAQATVRLLGRRFRMTGLQVVPIGATPAPTAAKTASGDALAPITPLPTTGETPC